ncbi:hypothetical protein DFJ58DRAFT_809142 [Suillus subalutaceus]|uniref:uncharacterized protein n=1 Tax=Suillus subalutaceus TaxID=48586 RepID=UPI001B860B5A|nr:uncharacterized protein DFJ58DRAFT_809142 [Suillus subalutaceus]KAG1840996.1 hypothetical protein DFJ58DRAFT_809142 [Suillus subalutaceus]
MPAVTLTQDATPSMQLTFPSSSQAESVQLPATQTFSTSCSADLPPSVGSREVRTIPKPQPKRRLKPEGSSLSEHIKNRDLQWFKAQQPPAARPGTLVLLNNVVVAPTAEKSKPSRVPGRIYPRPPPSELMTANQPTATGTIHRSSTSTQAPAPVDVKQSNEEKITPAVTDIATSGLQPDNTPRDSDIHPSGAPAPDVTTQKRRFPSCLVATYRRPIPRDLEGDMAVMIYRRGLESARNTINITFNLDDLHYSYIARWAKSKRTKSSLTSDLEQSVCVSFACYHLPSLPSNPLEGDGLTPRIEILMRSPCSRSGDGKDFIIPLAPPIFVTPDNCIDISAFIRSGENTFSVVQQSDMSDYLFMFLVHYPTPEQLSYLASCRGRREEWAKSIRDLCKLELREP